MDGSGGVGGGVEEGLCRVFDVGKNLKIKAVAADDICMRRIDNFI